MGDPPSSAKFATVSPLIFRSLREGLRIRLQLKVGERGARQVRSVEGVILEVIEGRDGRSRLRIGIPTGSGEPVEVRVLLESVETAELATESDAPAPRSASASGRPITRARTLEYGTKELQDALKARESAQQRQSGIRTAPGESGAPDSWSEPPSTNIKRG